MTGLRRVALASAALAALAPVAGAATPAPRVPLMIVGKSRVLWSAHEVVAGRASVGSRHCGVGRATPLAALVAARRAHAPSFHVKDFSSCSSSPQSGAGLFVDRIGPDRNRNADGWVYKVGHRAGTAGAANPAGSFGDGRGLRDGDRVLWFWCRLGSGGCQRSLETAVSARQVLPGATLRVTVRGYDDGGRPRRTAGARVRFGDRTATTAADGTAQITAPLTPGRYAVSATHAGLVAAFPETVQVG